MLKNLFFADILKVNDENCRIRIQDPVPNPDPDPFVRGMDPRIRIRINPKMSWIRNTESKDFNYFYFGGTLAAFSVIGKSAKNP